MSRVIWQTDIWPQKYLERRAENHPKYPEPAQMDKRAKRPKHPGRVQMENRPKQPRWGFP
jgi:hypothetical protein